MMLVGRFFQGAGVAGPRTMTMALVRDKYSGPAMARVMSFIMTIFILVPIVAPSLGQVIQGVAGWRAIFGVYLTLALVASAWLALRQEETLDPACKIRFSPRRVAHAVRAVLATRKALGYTLAAGCIFGAFLGWLNSAQQILQEQYGLGTRFPLYFAMLAISVGGASLLNARLVMSHGMRRLAHIALATIGTGSLLCLAGAAVTGGHPPLAAMMAYLLVAFFSIGLLFSNLNALAMEPLGHVAGTGASVVGGLSTTISLPLGTLVGQAYDGTVIPLVAGFFVLSLLSMLAMRWAEGGES
jgi:DHA1 family bicyclomycin/chloramphenicol resistance-like MFS transporter